MKPFRYYKEPLRRMTWCLLKDLTDYIMEQIVYALEEEK